MSQPNQCSNLQNFLHFMTPIVPSKQSCLHELNNIWHSRENDAVTYFTLGDLWRSFHDKSAFGVGTPVVLSKDRVVMQYYAPYLSAIQIYTVNSTITLRNLKEEINVVNQFGMKPSSDESEINKFSRSLNNNPNKTWDYILEDSKSNHEGSLPIKDRLGDLYFQYQDLSSPYWRIPIVEKIDDFAQSYPGLLTLKSIDLSPASWMSIAWYPIYHIPTKWYVKDLSTSFLTYHTLSFLFQDSIWENDNDGKEISCPHKKDQNQVSLPPFGLATHKMQGDVWINHGKYDHEKMINLHSAADSWLKQLEFHHHDFNFFNMHYTYEK